eukprot:CAMPEP_0197850898 /NCGR_PEP_ID=MMETSP1438-20131217/16692_1 /TAXON_ID=1461541 /ORGANISM="Pterosperma sp., Strain CCMP1384" /LENGTH=61 /DNA_ID=CAMNT_0043464295 /DNA_START=1335 /DNA_END=1521 /DNA_ORIENTATION=-
MPHEGRHSNPSGGSEHFVWKDSQGREACASNPTLNNLMSDQELVTQEGGDALARVNQKYPT